jgi:hypothetical protein
MGDSPDSFTDRRIVRILGYILIPVVLVLLCWWEGPATFFRNLLRVFLSVFHDM